MQKEIIRAIYENGVLRPLESLNLPDQTQVELTIERTILPDEVGDPLLELIGAYRSERSLIDGIPVSEDPGLYLIAEAMGQEAVSLHAWEIAPQRYRRGENDRPIRIALTPAPTATET